MTYDITTSVGKVRLMIGDTDTTNEVFTDAEITYFLTLNSSNLNLAAADALEAWMAKYTTSATNERIGDYSYSQDIVNKMNKLRNELIAKVNSTPVFEMSQMDLSGVEDTTIDEDIE